MEQRRERLRHQVRGDLPKGLSVSFFDEFKRGKIKEGAMCEISLRRRMFPTKQR